MSDSDAALGGGMMLGAACAAIAIWWIAAVGFTDQQYRCRSDVGLVEVRTERTLANDRAWSVYDPPTRCDAARFRDYNEKPDEVWP